MTRAWLCIAMFAAACAAQSGDDGATPDDATPSDDGKTDAPTPPTTITVHLTGRASSLLNFVAAYQEGAEPWKAAPSSTGDAYSFVVTSPTWSFAWGCSTVQSSRLYVAAHVLSYALSDTTTVVVAEDCPRVQPSVTVKGTVTSAPSGPAYGVFWGEPGGQYLTGGATNTFGFEIARRPGTHDLYAGAYEFVQGNGTWWTKLAVKRGLVATTNISNAAIDLASALSTTPALPVTLDALANETTSASTWLYDTSGTVIDIDDTWLGPPHTTRGLAPSQFVTGSIYAQKAATQLCVGDVPIGQFCDRREVEHWTTSIAAKHITLPPALGPVTATTNGASLSATWPAYPDAVGYTWLASWTDGDYVPWSGTIGVGFAGNVPRLTIPDLSGLPGWDHFLLKPTSGEINGVVRAHRSSRGISDFPAVMPAPTGTDRVTVESHLLVDPS